MEKSADAFRIISEVAEELDVPQHVLRFWETRFTQIRPLKRGGGRRYYRPDDVDLLRAIRHLLYGEGYTIKGVQRLLKENGARAVAQMPRQDIRPSAYPPTGPVEADFEAEVTMAPNFVRDEPEMALERHESELNTIAATAMHGGLSKNDLQLLRSALADLDECERILVAARAA